MACLATGAQTSCTRRSFFITLDLSYLDTLNLSRLQGGVGGISPTSSWSLASHVPEVGEHRACQKVDNGCDFMHLLASHTSSLDSSGAVAGLSGAIECPLPGEWASIADAWPRSLLGNGDLLIRLHGLIPCSRRMPNDSAGKIKASLVRYRDEDKGLRLPNADS